MKVGIIGSGIGALASAIELKRLGLDVHVFEANAQIGGKIVEQNLANYRFDMGPSVFTEPQLLADLLQRLDPNQSFAIHQLEESCRYFFNDGQHLIMPVGNEKVAQTFAEQFGEDALKTKKYLERLSQNYKAIYPVFIQISLHRFKHLFGKHLIGAIMRIFKYGLHQTMHRANSQHFQNPKSAQILDRLATYNGSSPYLAPAMLNIISQLELSEGPAMPVGGMVQITRRAFELAQQHGVVFHTNERVNEILHQNQMIIGLKTSNGSFPFDIVVSNMDIHYTYEQLLPSIKAPQFLLKQEKSSSAVVFYWGINKIFPELGVHNIFFAEDYKAEFKAIFETKTLYQDPTIYIHISSKVEKNDAPEGKENWFVMVNAPINVGQDWDREIQLLRTRILKKLSKSLGTEIEPLIEVEQINEPRLIDARYSGKQGSIYGNASNNAFSAFLRHPNFSKQLKGLYFAGVTVHPGGGIPLAINSAKIVARCVQEDYPNLQTQG
ncbi:MAG: 1-hydroxycarotenoid 3,4-desaturase CrtD [Flavobacteriales bacterium]